MDSRLFRQACYINGQWIEASSSKSIDIVNPADQKVIGRVPDFSKTETNDAIKAAHDAFLKWRALSAKDRSDILLCWFGLIDLHKAELAEIMTVEQGKPLSESEGEIDYTNSFIKWFAEEGRRVYGDIIPASKDKQRLFVIKQPVGVVAAITPWNFPSAMITRKIAPALAVGCSVVVKPDSQTPFSAIALAVLAEEAGIPAGVFNIVTGDSKAIGEALTGSPVVKKLSFTGSTPVGKLLMSQCADTVKKISLELGGNAPFIVFDDADIDAAVSGAMASKYRNTGQTCVCANRIFVHETIYDEFAEKLKSEVDKLKVGNGLEDGVQQGPLINEKAVEKVERHIKDAVDKGAKILTGGKRHKLGGTYFEPTILTNVNSDMQLANEETFGPVAPLFRFSSDDEAIAMANDTQYGLASYFYSKDVNRIWRVAEALEYGMVGINSGMVSTEVAPFGGVKESGIGREGSKYGLDEYLEMKYLCMQE